MHVQPSHGVLICSIVNFQSSHNGRCPGGGTRNETNLGYVLAATLNGPTRPPRRLYTGSHNGTNKSCGDHNQGQPPRHFIPRRCRRHRGFTFSKAPTSRFQGHRLRRRQPPSPPALGPAERPRVRLVTQWFRQQHSGSEPTPATLAPMLTQIVLRSHGRHDNRQPMKGSECSAYASQPAGWMEAHPESGICLDLRRRYGRWPPARSHGSEHAKGSGGSGGEVVRSTESAPPRPRLIVGQGLRARTVSESEPTMGADWPTLCYRH